MMAKDAKGKVAAAFIFAVSPLDSFVAWRHVLILGEKDGYNCSGRNDCGGGSILIS